jgi:hypothetical protein
MNRQNQSYKVRMGKNEVDLFKNYLSKANSYFEFGCGGSTILADSYNNIQNIISVDSCLSWIELTKSNITSNKVSFMQIDINADCNRWGIPKDKSLVENWIKYPTSILNYDQKFDLILIDGRFRRSCCATAAMRTAEDSFILLHDYKRYGNLPIKKIDHIENLAVYKKNELSDEELIKFLGKYQYDPR